MKNLLNNSKVLYSYESQYQFRPEISSIISIALDDHVERLYNSKKETEECLQNRRKELNQLVDPVTGQDFFKPIVGRPPKYQRDLPISEYLYKMREKKSVEEPKLSQLDLVGKHRSEEILIKRKKSRYLEIFNLINSFDCEKIYSDVINLDRLDPEIIRIILPLIQELEETGERLDFDEFYDSMENLCKFLTPEEKYTLLKEKIKIEPKFEENKRGNASTGRIYSRNLKYKEDTQAKLVAERIKKSDDELKECTFHPKIKNYKRIKQSKTNQSWYDY